MNRRHFLPAAAVSPLLISSLSAKEPRAREKRADVVIVGGVGGCAAALAAAHAGRSVLLTEETN
jgi:NADPH-dependent 2,4-dienoyl-CoA reductase/sulfur reductase-like enzyme